MSEQLPDPDAAGGTAPKVEKPTAVETGYVILTRDDPDASWTDSGVVSARSAEAAIRSVGKEGTYVAIPARSWRPVTVKAEVVTTLKLEDAT